MTKQWVKNAMANMLYDFVEDNPLKFSIDKNGVVFENYLQTFFIWNI